MRGLKFEDCTEGRLLLYAQRSQYFNLLDIGAVLASLEISTIIL